MKYSYWCKSCGYWSMSNDKREIAKIEKVHRSLRGCRTMPVGDGTRARADLIPAIREANEKAKSLAVAA